MKRQGGAKERERERKKNKKQKQIQQTSDYLNCPTVVRGKKELLASSKNERIHTVAARSMHTGRPNITNGD